MQFAGNAGSVGNYVVDQELGAGAFGTVYRGHHAATGQVVAIKMLDRAPLEQHQAREVLRREAAALLRVRSPHCLQVLDIIDTPETLAMVTDFVEGVTLRSLLDSRGPLSALEAVQVIWGAAQGLAAVHAAGLVHGDVKPANILLDRSGNSRLIDFGLAGVPGRIDQDEVAPYGSPAYASPEQITSGYRDARSDIYALGVTMYELICNRRPFQGNIAQILEQKRTLQVPDPRHFVPNLPVDVAQVLVWPLQLDLTQRPADVASFITYLEAAAQNNYGPNWRQPVTLAAAVASVAGATASGVVVATAGSGAAAAGATAATGGAAATTGGGLLAAGTAKVAIGITVAAVAAAGTTSAVVLTQNSSSKPPAPTMANVIALIKCPSSTAPCTLETMTPDGGHVRTIAQLPAGSTGLTWSKDGSKFAYVVQPTSPGGATTDNGDIHVVSSSGSGDHVVAQGSDPAWSPSGAQLAYTHCEGDCSTHSLHVLNADGSNDRTLDPTAGGLPSWSPNGTKIAYFRLGNGYGGCGYIGENLYVIGANGTGKRQLSSSADFLQPVAWMPDSQSVFVGQDSTTVKDPTCHWAAEAAALINVSTGASTQVVDAADQPVLSPDGQHIAYSTNVSDASSNWTSTLWIANSNGTGVRKVLTAPSAVAWPGLQWSPNSASLLSIGGTATIIDAATGSTAVPTDNAYSGVWGQVSSSTVAPNSTAGAQPDLSSAIVPANCGLPAQRLVGNQTATSQNSSQQGSGNLNLGPNLVLTADFGGLGYPQTMTEYSCNAGGVGWPDTVVLIGNGGALLGSFDLSFLGTEHADVTSLTLQGNTAQITWEGYEGAGTNYVRGSGVLTYSNGVLTLTHRTDAPTSDASASNP